MKYTLSILLFAQLLQAHEAKLGNIAPTFKLKGSPVEFDLSKHKGEYIVLEWYNDGCPFVRKHYDSGNMQSLQKKYGTKVKWLTINSSASGKQGYLKGIVSAEKKFKEEKMNSTSLLLDSDGKVGKEYGAKTTPHFFIIDPSGNLVYQGAIDSISSSSSTDIPKSQNYISLALDDLMAGNKVKISRTRPYGCSVKY